MKIKTTNDFPAPALASLNFTDLPILVAGDHPINGTLLARQLEAFGLHVVLAKNGVDALSCWRSRQFSLIITDCELPEMDGCALVTTIREIETCEERPRIPIIVWTAKILPEDIADCIKIGMNDLQPKPATQKELTQILTKWLTAIVEKNMAAPTASVPFIAVGYIDAPVFDPGVLVDMLGDDPVVHRKLINSFLEVAQNSAVGIQYAIEMHDVSALKEASHKLKSSARVVGALQFAGACEALEYAGSNATWAEIQLACGVFQAAFKRMNTELIP